MRHLPARGRLISRGRGGAGLPIGWGATGPGGGSRGTHERRTKRSPWGGKLQRGLKTWGGGCGGGSGETCFVRLDVDGIRVGRRKWEGGWLRGAAEGGGCGIIRFWGVGGRTGGYWASRAIPVTCRVVLRAVGAASRGGDAAVEDWFEISTPRAGWIGAAMLLLAWGPAQRGHMVGFLQRNLTWPNLQQLLHCLQGDEG